MSRTLYYVDVRQVKKEIRDYMFSVLNPSVDKVTEIVDNNTFILADGV